MNLTAVAGGFYDDDPIKLTAGSGSYQWMNPYPFPTYQNYWNPYPVYPFSPMPQIVTVPSVTINLDQMRLEALEIRVKQLEGQFRRQRMQARRIRKRAK